MASPIVRVKNPGPWLKAAAILPAPLLVASSAALIHFVEPEKLLEWRTWIWSGYVVVLALWAMLIGQVYSDAGYRSIVIDGTNRMSLSLVQFGFWSLLLLGTVPLAFIMNLIVDVNPWTMNIPTQLFIASGVSLTTLIAAGFIDKDGEQTTPDPQRMASQVPPAAPDNGDDAVPPANGAPVNSSNVGNSEWGHRGVVLTRENPKEASFADLVTGTTFNGGSRIDLARVQMLVLTLTLVGTYTVQITKAIDEVAVAANGTEAVPFTFPSMSQELIGLLALSSLGYLGGKKLDIHMSSEKS